MLSDAAAARCSGAAGEREAAAAGGLDTGEAAAGERAQLLQGEGTSDFKSITDPTNLILEAFQK